MHRKIELCVWVWVMEGVDLCEGVDMGVGAGVDRWLRDE
jgi:hypothetical protein